MSFGGGGGRDVVSDRRKPTRRITIYCTDDNIMAHMPNDQVKFLTFVQFLKLAWYALRHKVEVKIEESDHG